MARNLVVGEQVYVAWQRLGLDFDRPYAIVRGTIAETSQRSVRIRIPDGQLSSPVAAAAVHRHLGILLIRIGDFQTETTLLDPLTKSLLQFCRLLLEDDSVFLLELRSALEVSLFWQRNHHAYSHILLIGHGSSESIGFIDGTKSATELAEILSVQGQLKKVFLSLCCFTGRAAFAREFSRMRYTQCFIAPFQNIHGAVASQFAQTFLALHLLKGKTDAVAFRHSRSGVPDATSFRFWQRGNLVAGPK